LLDPAALKLRMLLKCGGLPPFAVATHCYYEIFLSLFLNIGVDMIQTLNYPKRIGE